MARTARRKGGKGQNSLEPEAKNEYDNLSNQPPPPPDIDPAAQGYAAYGGHGGDYGSHDLNSHASGGSPGVRRGSPQPNRAYFPAGGPTSAGGEYSVDEHAHHSQHLPPLSEALHPEDNHHYPHPAAYEPASHHTDATHASYDHGSSNFFDPQIMDAPASAGTEGRHGSIHHATNGNGANHFNGNIMTPPPPGSHGGYASSPYQAGHNSAPHMFHRASISGPVMHSHYPPPPGTPTPSAAAHATANHNAPQANDMAAWGTPSGSARPHTADGMFNSQMGGLPPQWAGSQMGGGSDYNRVQRGSTASMTSLPDGQHGSSGGKVFSYMPGNGDDSSSVGGSGSQSGSGPKKRPRRRYDEIERLYNCSWPGCQKSYGTLNHLNAHVAMQKHGAKRSPGEFKEMRKAWRKGKREDEQRRQANQAAANEEVLSRSNKMMFPAPTNQPFMTHGGYPVNNFGPPPPHVMPPPGQMPRYQMHPQASMYGNPSGGYSVDPSGRPYPSTHQGPNSGSQQMGQGSSGLGAYLMAHRGSI